MLYQISKSQQQYNIGELVSYPELLVLSKPYQQQLTYKEMECANQHKVRIIKLFALDEKYCPICQIKYDDKESPTEKLNVYAFTAKKENDKIMFYSMKPVDIEIYDKISIKDGNSVSVASKYKGVFNQGVLLTDKATVEKFVQEKSIQKSFLTKEKAIEEFMANRPIPNYPTEVYNAWKHCLFLSMVKSDINVLTIAEAGFGKTEAALQMKELTDGAYVDTPLTSSVALIGIAIKEMTGSYHFEGGAIFQSRGGNVLLVDEVEKMMDYNYLRQINSLIANHTFNYRKANIVYEDNDFHISFVGFGNPNTKGMLFQGIPKYIIDSTFSHNPEFLSRMHLIFAFRNKGSDTSKIRKINMESIKGFINYARSIVVKEPEQETIAKITELAKDYASKTNDSRAFIKVKNLCSAEAKLNLSQEITDKEINGIKELLDIQIRLLYER